MLIGSSALIGFAGLSVTAKGATETKLSAAYPPLPYADDALAPVISSETIGYHYGKHHKGYYDAVLKAVAGTEWADASLEEIVRKTAGDPIRAALFNPAGQLWNHNFYWASMRPNGGGKPTGPAAGLIEASFGGYDGFRKEFSGAATKFFGSGWIWLVQDGKDKAAIVATSNADTPIAHGGKPLLTLDVWEHSYYIDWRNRRADYANAWLDKLVNWDFVNQKLAA
ncbi:superoxide dismutase [Methylocapsa acidiphila]|uniref:superoxide dismutase n=1 Tax=Methylocapsa acidiphila TaxID=133552 RepID=UPI00041EA40F|nr:superoxide dismutase [Methylocapsa acidiphila]